MPDLYRVAWDTTYTKRTLYGKAQTLELAQDDLSFLRSRHPIQKYRLEKVNDPDPAPTAEPAPRELVSGQHGLERANRR